MPANYHLVPLLRVPGINSNDRDFEEKLLDTYVKEETLDLALNFFVNNDRSICTELQLVGKMYIEVIFVLFVLYLAQLSLSTHFWSCNDYA